MPRDWPDPSDTSEDRVKAISREVWKDLLRVAPELALKWRALAEEFQEYFLSEPLRVEPDQRITDAEAARLCDVSESTIRNWVSAGLVTRHPDGLEVGELLEVKARQRRRRGHR